MNDNVDWRKLAKQEPEFVAFCKDVMWDSMLTTAPDFLKSVYSFYAIGMTAKQVTDWMIMNAKFSNPSEGKS